jgi:CHASE3 domain sensor protein/cell division protein FtsL
MFKIKNTEKAFIYGIYLLILLLIINVAINFFYRNVVAQYVKEKDNLIELNSLLDNVSKTVMLSDLGLRGYYINPEEGMLEPFRIAQRIIAINELEESVKELDFDLIAFKEARKAYLDYLALVEDMVNMLQNGNMEEVQKIVEEDRGLEAYNIYGAYLQETRDEMNERLDSIERKYNTWRIVSGTSLILFFIVCVAILIFAAINYKKTSHRRRELLKGLDSSNRTLVFNNGEEIDTTDQDSVTKSILENLKLAAQFIKGIAENDYNVNWDGLNENNEHLNQENISGELVKLREHLKELKDDDEKRIWKNEGLTKFADIVRKYQNDVTMLSENIISEIVQYMEAKQGGLFIINDPSESERYLEMVSCYAYERHKFMEKKVKPGEGMIGQCYLEGELIYLENVPQNYLNITSGIGMANPESLVIVPLKSNDQIEGVLEIASFKKYEKYHLDFLEQLAEIIASAIITVRTNEHTRGLLEQSQQQAEEMKAQEEEMRQNMEELQATQEQMHRKTREYEDEIRSLKDDLRQLKGEAVDEQ